jgi:hypothetical protein
VNALENIAEVAFHLETSASAHTRPLKFRKITDDAAVDAYRPATPGNERILESLSHERRAAAAKDDEPQSQNYSHIWRIEPQAAVDHVAQTLAAGHQHSLQVRYVI